jgi:hypothetical protein
MPLTIGKTISHEKTPSQILHAIRRRIKYEGKDTLLSHIKTIARWDDPDYSGNVEEGTFVLWRCDSWSRAFYGVVYGTVTVEDGKTTISYIVLPNIAGALLGLLLVAGFFLGFFFDHPNGGVTAGKVLLATIISALFAAALYLSYIGGRRRTIADFKDLLKKVC